MNQYSPERRPKLTLTDLERREVPAVFNIPNPAVVGQTAAQTALINAINASNTNEQDDTINLFPNAVYSLNQFVDPDDSGIFSNALPEIAGDPDDSLNTHTLTINGRGATLRRDTASGDDFRIMTLVSDGFLFIQNTTLADGNPGPGLRGGAILVNPTAGIDVRNCLFVNNTSQRAGGAIAFSANTDVGFLYNTTFTDNTNFQDVAEGGGGAIYVDEEADFVVINNCTISNNANFSSFLQFQNDLFGAGIRAFDNIELTNTIVFGNLSDETIPDDINDGAEFEANNSIIGEFGTSVITGNNPQLNADPLLRPLANNGGQSLTMALRSGSPAINNGTSGVQLPGGLTTDQRGVGFARRVGNIDIGAYEFKPNSRLVLRSSRNPSRVGDMVTFTATVLPTIPRFNIQGAAGSIQFFVNGKLVETVPVVNNGQALVASFRTNLLPRGTHVIRAVYTDTDPEAPLDSVAGSLNQVVGKQGRRWIR